MPQADSDSPPPGEEEAAAETVDALVPARVRRRQESAALRERVLQTAVEMVGQMDALTIGIEDLSMEQVIREAQAPRSSVYRLWPYRGDFTDDVLVALASPQHMSNLAFDEETTEGAEQDAANVRAEDLADPEFRRVLTQTLVRKWALFDLQRLTASREWQEYIALIAGTQFVRSIDARERLAIELQKCERTFIERMATFYESMSKMLGLRLRPGLTYRHLALALAAILEGVALRQTLVAATKDTPRRLLTNAEQDWTLAEIVEQPLETDSPPPTEEADQWHLATYAFQAILDGFTEEDPNYTPA